MECTVNMMSESDELVSLVDDFVRGVRPLTGLELYYELECTTPLIGFHTIIRRGPQNRMSCGLQPSYGDHNRLLMLALDKLVARDLEWYRSRLDGAGDISDADLLACFDAVAALELSPDALLALWLAAALHDCGMLKGRGSHIDVEDGVVLARGIIGALCPPELRDFSSFVIHNHDYIKGLFLGEVPVANIADELDHLDAGLRPLALAALGVIQVVGAASLGDGRLGSFRMEIFDDCLLGRALDDPAVPTRLSRLLEPVPRAVAPDLASAHAALADLGAVHRSLLDDFLERAAVHGWHRSFGASAPFERTRALLEVAELWERASTDHVVLELGSDPSPSSLRCATTRVETPLSGTTVLVLEANQET